MPCAVTTDVHLQQAENVRWQPGCGCNNIGIEFTIELANQFLRALQLTGLVAGRITSWSRVEFNSPNNTMKGRRRE